MKAITTTLVILYMAIYSTCEAHSDKEYLSYVLEKMSKIESVTYHCITQTWEPGDRNPLQIINKEIYEHINLQDTAIGSSYVTAADKNFKQPYSIYDGKEHTSINKEKKEILIDDFTQKRPLPFRMVMPCFFYRTKSIIDYALTTTDSITIHLNDLGKEYMMEVIIHMPNQVEFFGKARYIPASPYIIDPTSVYKIWISKKNDLPYRLRREMEHSISEETCSDFIFNPSDKREIVAKDYYPANYTKRIIGKRSKRANITIIGEKAPEWTLIDMNDCPVSLCDIKSKVILLQLTGIGCGPCKISIPLLNELRKKYSEDDLEILAIETWGKTKSSCENYIRNHQITYRFLSGDKETIAKLINDYQAGGVVPQFFIIGKNRTITKLFQGYNENITGKELEKEIRRNL